MKSLATQYLENEVIKKEKELESIKGYQDLIRLKKALDYSKILDKKKLKAVSTADVEGGNDDETNV